MLADREPFEGEHKECADCHERKRDTVSVELGEGNIKFRLCIDCCEKFGRIVDEYEKTNWKMLREEILNEGRRFQKLERANA